MNEDDFLALLGLLVSHEEQPCYIRISRISLRDKTEGYCLRTKNINGGGFIVLMSSPQWVRQFDYPHSALGWLSARGFNSFITLAVDTDTDTEISFELIK